MNDVMPVFTQVGKWVKRIMIKLRALLIPERRVTRSPTDFVQTTQQLHDLQSFPHSKTENWHRQWSQEQPFWGIKNKQQMLGLEMNVKHIDSMFYQSMEASFLSLSVSLSFWNHCLTHVLPLFQTHNKRSSRRLFL